MDTAVVTGASRGVGEAVARRFAEGGGHVVGCSRDAEELDAVVADVAGAGGAMTGLRADVRDEYDVERLMEAAARAGDAAGIDCVVANAGVYHGAAGESPLPDAAYSAFDDTLRVNVRGVFSTVREAVPHLTDGARALVPSGGVARDATAGYGAYAVSKAAAEAVARQFAAELDATVGVLDVGRVDTALTDLDGGRDPADAAAMTWWAATAADADDVDGAVLELGDYKRATR
jgi:NAD(P)-dependent dehydrogenase (short-subunit alcohol dehydrogenase family)